MESKLEPLARLLATKGAYVLPLDSKEAASRLTWSLRPVDLKLGRGGDRLLSLTSTPFDVLVLNPAGHMLESAAAYMSEANAKLGKVQMPSSGGKLESQPTVWEVLETSARGTCPRLQTPTPTF